MEHSHIKHDVAEIDTLYRKYFKLEGVRFAMGSNSKAVLIEKKYEDKLDKINEENTKTMMKAAKPAGDQAAEMNRLNAEYEALRKKKPQVVNRYEELTKKGNEEMNQGKKAQGEKTLAEAQKVAQSDQEFMAHLLRRQEALKKQFGEPTMDYDEQNDYIVWGHHVEKLDDLMKILSEGYNTGINIEVEVVDPLGKLHRDRPTVDKLTKDFTHGEPWRWGSPAQAQQGQNAQNSAPAQNSAQQQSPPERKASSDKKQPADKKQAEKKPTDKKQADKKPEDNTTDSLKKKLQTLKKLF